MWILLLWELLNFQPKFGSVYLFQLFVGIAFYFSQYSCWCTYEVLKFGTCKKAMLKSKSAADAQKKYNTEKLPLTVTSERQPSSSPLYVTVSLQVRFTGIENILNYVVMWRPYENV